VYAVIFRAEMNEIDTDYSETSSRMRELAINEYGCIDFVSVTEGNSEISISFWESEEQIEKWKLNSEHINAQILGRNKWYKRYSVEVVEVLREYRSA
jgi:heme-degrading monooxygenase HmoA